MEVEANAKVVKVAAELEFILTAFKSVSIAKIEKFSLGYVVTRVGF